MRLALAPEVLVQGLRGGRLGEEGGDLGLVGEVAGVVDTCVVERAGEEGGLFVGRVEAEDVSRPDTTRISAKSPEEPETRGIVRTQYASRSRGGPN